VTTCATCGMELRENAKFCDECGSPVGWHTLAEYKQVTVLSADVVRSMDIAAAVGPERLREIMTDLLDRSAAVVERFGGTLNQFTGDGIMAVFGAPITLEDHAIRACLAALDLQNEMGRLAADVNKNDSVDLRLRVGLNSGQVIAGEIGSGAAGYTTIGEQVGMAQRMESAAPPGGVMLSESTARLVENEAALGEPELVHIKRADGPVPARRLFTVGEPAPTSRGEANLVGRMWELNTIAAILDEAIEGAGCVVNIVGPPGIGKSRLVREAAGIASGRGVGVITTQCESHTREIPFHVLKRLLRAGTHVSDLDAQAAREQLRDQFIDADPDDLVLLEDLLGISDSEVELPPVGPDARRRRLTTLINSASLERADPAVYVIEDAQWIDEASESMLTDFLAVIPHSPSLTLVTYRPEYRGALAKLSGAQTIALRPLSEAHASALTAELLGPDPSVADVAASIVQRAAGKPFFAEEMVRDLAERGVLHGQPGEYQMLGDTGDTNIPATLQATIGARIDPSTQRPNGH
jgi:adenylate cyclase